MIDNAAKLQVFFDITNYLYKKCDNVVRSLLFSENHAIFAPSKQQRQELLTTK